MIYRISFQSFYKNEIFVSSEHFFKILESLKIQNSNIISLPTKIKKFCVLRSPHVNKNSMEHFELRIYKKFIDILLTEQQLIADFEKILEFEIPFAVAVNIKKL